MRIRKLIIPFVSAILSILILPAMFRRDVLALSLEQQINIINQEYSTTSTTAAPDDNSLGTFYWDAAKYSNIGTGSTELEVDMKTSATSVQMIAALYDSAGNLLPQSRATIGNANTITTIDGCPECVKTNDSIYDSMILDTSGFPILVYVQQDISTGFGTGDGDLMVTHCGDANCKTGNVTTTVDGCSTCQNNIDVGKHTSIKLNAAGFPVIAYHQETSDSVTTKLLLVVCGNLNCSSGNTYTAVDSGGTSGLEDVGQYADMVLDSNYYPVMTYFDATDDDLYFVHCGSTDCATGNTFVRPLYGASSSAGQYNSIVLDSSGYPVIAFRDGNANHDLRLIHCTDANCSGTNSGNIVTDATNSYKSGNGTAASDSAGVYNSLQLDTTSSACTSTPKECPVISFGRGTFGSDLNLILAHCNDNNCSGSDETFNMLDGCATGDSSGCSTTTDCASATASDCDEGDVGWYNKLQLDSTGYPVISYRSQAAGDLKVIHCNDVNCAGNNDSVVRVDGCTGCDIDGSSTSTGAGGYTSLQLDSSGSPVVSYRRVGPNGGSNDLKFVHCGNANCNPTGSGQGDPTSYQRAVSMQFTPSLTGGASTRTLTLRVWVNSGTGYIKAARLKIRQASSTTITDSQTQAELGDNQTITATTATELTNPKYYYYDSSKFSGTKSAYVEASLLGGGGGQGNGRIWSSGFELNSNTANVEFTTMTGTTAIESTYQRSGSYAGKVDISSTTGKFQQPFQSSAAAIDVYYRFYFYFDSVNNGAHGRPSTTTFIAGISKNLANNTLVVAYNSTTNVLELRKCTVNACTSSDLIGSSSAVTADAWHRLEIHSDSTLGDGAEVGEAKLDGTSFASASNLTLDGPLYVNAGIIVTNSTTTMYIDDIAVNNATGGWPGPGKIIHLHPSATGSNKDWTASSGTDNYTLVDEASPNDVTDYVSTATNNNIDDYYITGAAASIAEADDINAVQVGVRFANATSTTSTTFQLRLSDHIVSNTDTGSSITSNSLTYGTNSAAAADVYTLTSYTVPGSSTEPWTPAELDRSQIGIKKTSASVNIQVSTIWALVDYTPVADMTGTLAEAKLQQCDESSCSWTDVTGGTITSASSSWKRIRSADLSANLTSGRRYRIAFWKSADSGTLKVANAKFIIEQTSASGLTDLELVHQYINTLATDTDDTYTSSGFVNQLTPGNFSGGTFTYYYEAVMKTSAGTTGTVQIFNTSTGISLASAISSTGTSFARIRSSDISSAIPTATSSLDSQLKNSASSGNTTSVTSTWLVIQISPSTAAASSSSSSSSSSTTAVGSADPNLRAGWKCSISAGPHHVGLSTYIPGPSDAPRAAIFVSDNAHHDDLCLQILVRLTADLANAIPRIPFPWEQRLNVSGPLLEFKAVASFNGYPVTLLDNPATVVLQYDPDNLFGFPPDLLRLAWYDKDSKLWRIIPENTVVDQKNYTVANVTRHLSLMAVVYPAPTVPEEVLGADTEQNMVPTFTPTPRPTPVPPSPPTRRKRCFWFICW